MALILLLETTTINCSVALAEDDKVIAIKEDKTPGYSHAEKLHLFMEAVLAEGQKELLDLDAVAVSKGPGSYTGLRIGVSAAKGLCYALNIPLIAVDTLTSIAHQYQSLNFSSGYVIPVLDARRMEVYTSVFELKGGALTPLSNVEAKIIDENSYAELKANRLFVGDGVQKIEDEILDQENSIFVQSLPSTQEMAKIAFDKYKISDTEDVAYFEPFYLKDFVIKKKKKA
ncbi:tRNA (adenosine(37)-N6)-threonylcarbamoyltransferase complex dimerization subunit type 1 TsaB [Mesonia sp.]|uniref:tRNA (adenosine(37)-N6)-threonylcarbamoyltransferase complex dimerization subunit type 1 TsaB n=1 Tax=Mesonia sp. TaxID=1960830 RepID=UPI003F9A819F